MSLHLTLLKVSGAPLRDISANLIQKNQERLIAFHRWYDDLYARRKSDGLELTYSEITHELTGRRFNAFCLNKQMYFSDDIAVLTLPYPRDIATAGVPSDRLVGVILHDFEASDVNWKMTYQQGIEELNISAEHAVIKAHNDIIFGELKARLVDAGLPDNERQHLSAQSNMRISKDLPLAGTPHHDILVREEKDRLLEPSWDRFIIHVLHGPETKYFLGEDQNILVTVPTGTTSGHFAAHVNHPKMKSGVYFMKRQAYLKGALYSHPQTLCQVL